MRVLVTDGPAGVVRTDDGALWLTGAVARGPGTGLQGYRPAVEGIERDRTVQGGRLPPDAVAATVIDRAGAEHAAAVGEGAWVLVLDDAIRGDVLPVRFTDAAGRLVAPPPPAGGSRAPVDDADTACPACGAVGWDADEDVVVCRTCGHEERIGSFIRFDEAGGEVPEGDVGARIREHQREAIRAAAVPVYALPGRPGEVVSWGTSSVTIAHDEALSVESAREAAWRAGEAFLAREALAQLLSRYSPAWPDVSEPALTLWLRARDRASERVAARAALVTYEVPVDGAPTAFAVVADGERWAAVACHGEILITLQADGEPLAGVTLERAADPERFIPD